MKAIAANMEDFGKEIPKGASVINPIDCKKFDICEIQRQIRLTRCTDRKKMQNEDFVLTKANNANAAQYWQPMKPLNKTAIYQNFAKRFKKVRFNLFEFYNTNIYFHRHVLGNRRKTNRFWRGSITCSRLSSRLEVVQ
jgi:hypothetical protein